MKTAQVQESSVTQFVAQPAPPSPTSTDGWGDVENGILSEDQESDKDGWDDIEPHAAVHSSVLEAAQERPVAYQKSQSNVLPKAVIIHKHSVFTKICTSFFQIQILHVQNQTWPQQSQGMMIFGVPFPHQLPGPQQSL